MGAIDCKPCCTKPTPLHSDILESRDSNNPVLGTAFNVRNDQVPRGTALDDHETKAPKTAYVTPIEEQEPIEEPRFEPDCEPDLAALAPTEAWNPTLLTFDNQRTFEIHLQKGTNQKFGVEVEVHAEQSRLRVRTVGEGIVANWNDENPSLQVLPGCFIVKVNEAEGDPMKLIDIIKRSANLTMTIEAETVADASG
mmetsp:Transcript_73789/g.139381  ORF Transcript_73789/g.139381 Transcript_73789/m.139381 type:complete len:196 (-) Transcript_73789:103-690(-)